MYKISIIGGGISGLSAAIALSRFDLNIKVFEKSIRFSKLGAGIQLGPNAACVISSLGIYEEVLKKSSAPKNFFVYDINSKKYLYKKPLGKNQIEIYGYPYLTILRSDLHAIMEKKVLKNKKIEIFKNTLINDLILEGKVIAIRDQENNRFESDALIGADGYNSFVRTNHFKHEVIKKIDSVAFRTLVKNECEVSKKFSTDIKLWFGHQFHIVTYPVDQGKKINVVIVKKNEPNEEFFGWSNPCGFAELETIFNPKENLDLYQLLSKNKIWHKWPIYINEPIKNISDIVKGSIILCGDAGHYMKPHLAQGASMALEDSYEIMKSFKKNHKTGINPWEKVFKKTASKRFYRISKIQKISNRNGYIYQCSGVFRILRNFSLRIFGRIILNQKWLHKF